MKLFKSGKDEPTSEDLQFERALKDYHKVIRRLKAKAIRKYGVRAARWFA